MAGGLYEVDIRFRETGTGQARIVPPSLLDQVDWRYVQVNGADSKAIVRVDDTVEGFGDDPAHARLSEEEAEAKRRSWPRPKLKQGYVGSDDDGRLRGDAVGDAQTQGEPTTLQTVRWGFYLIDVPVDPSTFDEVG